MDAASNDASDSPPPTGRKAPVRPDLTTGPIGRTLLLFSLPVLGANVLQSVNGSANAAIVSHVLGEAALAAVYSANLILFLVLGAGFGATMAANLMIGQAFGSKNLTLAKEVVGTATTFFAVVSLGMGLFGFLAAPTVLDMVQTPPDVRADAIAYLRIVFVSVPFMFFFTFLMMAMRAVGDSRTPFWFSLISVILGVGLNPLLILGVGPLPRLGIMGSGVATLIAQAITLAAMIYYLHRTESLLVLKREDWRLLSPDWSLVRALVAKGFPMGIQMIVMSSSAVVMIGLVNKYGSHMAAAYGAANQFWVYVQMPAMALGASVSSMAAINVGAGRMDRVTRIAWVGSITGCIATALPIVVIYLFEPWLMRLFLPAASPATPLALHINTIVLWGFIPFGITFVLTSVVRATGAVWAPLIGMTIGMWVVRVPFAAALAPWMGANSIWWSFPFGALASAIFAFSFYRWGGWRKSKLFETRADVTP